MKITASKVSAIVFTVIAVAAFAWMTMRPSIDAQAAGFGLPSNSGSTTATAPPKDTNASSEAETTDKDSTSNSTTEEKDTENSEKESDEKTEEKSADDKTPADAKQDADSSADTAKPSADDASSTKQSNEEQSAEPTTPEAPTAPTAPTSPAAPSTSDSTDDQTDNKKKTDTEKASQADGVKATDLTAKTEESDQKSKSAIAAAAAIATTVAVVAQGKQTETDKENSSEIYTQADNARGTVVILSGCDYKPNAEGIVTTLHKSLPQKGWNTLSFQLPNLSSTSTFKDLEAVMPEVAKNIESSIAMAKEKSDTPVTLLAHGCGSQMALAWMEVKGNDSIDAYIGLGTGIMNSDAKDTDHLRIPLEAMKFPQLDIFGSTDNVAVLKTAPERLGHINRASNSASRQKIILDADHNMTGKEDVLARVIAKWLDKKAFKK